MYFEIISNFFDLPDKIFSIHTLAIEGQSFGLNIGEWFSPSILAKVIQTIVLKNQSVLPFSVYVASDALIQQNIIQTMKIPILILIPVRLGIEKIEKSLLDALLVKIITVKILVVL